MSDSNHIDLHRIGLSPEGRTLSVHVRAKKHRQEVYLRRRTLKDQDPEMFRRLMAMDYPDHQIERFLAKWILVEE